MERPKTTPFLEMAFAKTTLTMTNATMTALIVALHPVIGTIALNVIAKVFPITKPLHLELNFFIKMKQAKVKKVLSEFA